MAQVEGSNTSSNEGGVVIPFPTARRTPDHALAEGGPVRTRTFLTMSGPALLLMAALLIVPLAATITWSFQNVPVGRAGTFVGLANYRELLESPRFRSAGAFTVCFAVVDRWVVSAVDHKPKRTGQLRRLDDMRASGRATVLVDHYDEDWTQLWWVRVRGRAEVHEAGPDRDLAVAALTAKYVQYREQAPTGAVWRIAMDEVRWWRP